MFLSGLELQVILQYNQLTIVANDIVAFISIHQLLSAQVKFTELIYKTCNMKGVFKNDDLQVNK
jgi:hypothetical protein